MTDPAHIDLKHLEALVGPLPKCQHAEASMETREVVVVGIVRDALDEAYERLERVAEALPAHEWDDEWGVHYKVKLVPEPELERIEAEARKLVAALFTELDEEEATDVILAAFPHGAPAWVLAHYDVEHGGEA